MDLSDVTEMNTILKSEMMLQGRVYDTKFTLEQLPAAQLKGESHN